MTNDRRKKRSRNSDNNSQRSEWDAVSAIRIPLIPLNFNSSRKDKKNAKEYLIPRKHVIPSYLYNQFRFFRIINLEFKTVYEAPETES